MFLKNKWNLSHGLLQYISERARKSSMQNIDELLKDEVNSFDISKINILEILKELKNYAKS